MDYFFMINILKNINLIKEGIHRLGLAYEPTDH